MKIFDKYFQPYAEYCIRTAFTEDELKAALQKECRATLDVPSWQTFKASFGLTKRTVFSRHPDDPLHLTPIRGGRNSARGELFIQCEAGSENTTVLHILIAPQRREKYIVYILSIYGLLFCTVAAFAAAWWVIFMLIPFITILFVVLEGCRATAQEETPKIRQDFESFLRELEEKYSSQN